MPLARATLLVLYPIPSPIPRFPTRAGGNVRPCRPCVSREDSRRVGLCLASACLPTHAFFHRSAERQVWRVLRKHPECYSFSFFGGKESLLYSGCQRWEWGGLGRGRGRASSRRGQLPLGDSHRLERLQAQGGATRRSSTVGSDSRLEAGPR